MNIYVIYSKSEDQSYWSNEIGWVYDRESATKFTQEESVRFALPLSEGNDAEWTAINP